MNRTVLALDGIVVRLDGYTVLDRVTLSVAPGEILGVGGANGSGKTTLLDVICGLVPSADGRVLLGDRDVTRLPDWHRARLGIRRCFQQPDLFPSLAVAEAASVVAGSRTGGAAAVRASGLSGREGAWVADLSAGMRRALEVAAVVERGADVVLLDEPTAGLASPERRALVALLHELRERTGCAIVVVEHDMDFLTALADRIVLLRDGRLTAPHTPQAAGPSETKAEPSGALLSIALARDDRPSPPGDLPARLLTRFGLRQLASGILAVMTLGILNRVMAVELDIPLWLTGGLLAVYNLSAPMAIWIGHRSDRSGLRGLRRTPYIIGGSVLTGAMTAAAPFAAFAISGGSAGPAIAATVAIFALMGIGMYGSGTAYFALLADITATHGRGRAASVVYSMLMLGILAGVGLGTAVLNPFDRGRLVALFALTGLLVVVLTTVAVWGIEQRGQSGPRPGPAPTTAAFRRLWAQPGSRRFFTFMVAATFFVMLQQLVLEPFGGTVFDLSVRDTTMFSAIQITGVLGGLAVTGSRWAAGADRRRTAGAGLLCGATALCALAASGPMDALWTVRPAIFVLGVGLGLFTGAGIALMMDMTALGAAGLSMGLWTLAHALADGAATAGGGLLHAGALAVFGTHRAAYAAVFALEAAGMAATVLLLKGLDVAAFASGPAATEVTPNEDA